MKTKTAETLLCAYRREKANDPAIEKARRVVESDGELSRRLAEQVEFDGQMSRVVQAITPPEDLRQRLLEAGAGQGSGRAPFTIPLVVTAVCGGITVLILLVLFAMERSARYPGSEAVARLVASANTMTGGELSPATGRAGDLGDWFYMRGFEHYHLPEALAPAPAVGARLFRQDGQPVAQVAVDWHNAVIYNFRADSFGVTLPRQNTWKRLETEGWEAAVRQDGAICTLLALRGEAREMSDLLQTLEKP